MARLSRSNRLLICAALAALAYLTGLGRAGLWEPDEGRYGEIAREMIVSGDYITPHNDWVPYLEKPPLVYWTTAASIKLLGKNELAVRLQAAVASVGTVVVTAALGEAMFGVAVGIFAALALGLSPLFFIFARFATPDPLLTFFLTAALSTFYWAERTIDFHIGKGRRLMLLASALAALGTLTKGPVALLFAGVIGLLWLTWEGRLRDVRHIRWFECGAVYLGIVMPWFVAAQMRNPGFLGFFFIHEHVQRFLHDTEHGWGPWFFIPIVIVGMWPWIFLVPFGLLSNDHRAGGGPARSAVRLLLIWFLAVFIFFSIPRSKLGEYILPGLPPFALLAGLGLDRLRRFDFIRVRRTVAWYGAINLVVYALLAAGLVIIVKTHSVVLPSATGGEDGALLHDVALFGGIVGISGLILWGAVRFLGNANGMPTAIVATALLAAVLIAKADIDSSNAFSYRELAHAVARYAQNGCQLASYHHYTQSLPFYTEEREALVGYRGELAPFADTVGAAATFVPNDAKLRAQWTQPQCTILIANRSDWERLGKYLHPATIVGCQGKKIALINRDSFGGGDFLASCTDAALRTQMP